MGTRHEAPSPATGAAPALSLEPLTGRRGLRVSGEVGLATRGIWEGALEQMMHEDDNVIHLELFAVTFVDVAGAGALAAAAQRLPAGRRVVLHGPPPALCRSLDVFWPGLTAIEVSMS